MYSQQHIRLHFTHFIHFGLCTALISRTLALISNCKCITWRAPYLGKIWLLPAKLFGQNLKISEVLPSCHCETYNRYNLTAGWSSGLRSRLWNQRSRVQIPIVSRGFCDGQLHLLTSLLFIIINITYICYIMYLCTYVYALSSTYP
jgi:hypothetical protein